MIHRIVHFMRSLTEFEKNAFGIFVAVLGFAGFSDDEPWMIALPLVMAVYIMVHVLIKKDR